MVNEAIRPIRVRLELIDDFLSVYDKVMLKRYGESSTGESILRDVIIPSDMPLHNVHYMIQKAFGWQNSHLRRFILPEERYLELTKGTVQGWTDLVGVLFQPPSEGESDLFWDDDFNPEGRTSAATWLKKKYKGPYYYGGYFEHYEVAQEDVEDIVNNPREFEVKESFNSFIDRREKEPDTEMRVLRTSQLINMTLEEFNNNVVVENGTETLLERLLLDDVLAYYEEEISGEELFPLTNVLTYNYDFGDDWEVMITKHEDYEDLLEEHLVFEEEIREIEQLVVEKHKPYCIHQDGLPVLDDVGGLSGYAQFLSDKYEQRDLDMPVSDINTWATSMGWRPTKTVPRELI